MSKEREKLVKNVRTTVCDVTDGPFYVEWSSDDGGHHIQVLIEQHDDGKDVRVSLDEKFAGKRIIIMLVPEGYLDGYKERINKRGRK